MLSYLRYVLVLGPLFSVSALSQNAADDQSRFREVDRLFAEFDKPDSPGYAVAILRGGQPIYQRGYGTANLDYGVKITPMSAFNIASLSKQFTAACLALLILEGKASLEDEVSRYIPELKKYPERIHIKHLVYMTSGLRDYNTLPRKSGRTWDPSDFFTIDHAIEASLEPATLAFRPGTVWRYSNVNYMLLAKVVERVSGVAFPDFADQRLFRPLGMQSTQVNADLTTVIPNRVIGYNRRTPDVIAERRRGGLYVRSAPQWMQYHRNSPHFGGSGVVTTLEDLGRWDRNFYTKAFGGQAFHELMHRRMRFDHSKDNDAFGLVFGSHKGMETISYDGGDLGFSSSMLRFPGRRTTIFVLSNLGTGDAGRHARLIAEIVLRK